MIPPVFFFFLSDVFEQVAMVSFMESRRSKKLYCIAQRLAELDGFFYMTDRWQTTSLALVEWTKGEVIGILGRILCYST